MSWFQPSHTQWFICQDSKIWRIRVNNVLRDFMLSNMHFLLLMCHLTLSKLEVSFEIVGKNKIEKTSKT